MRVVIPSVNYADLLAVTLPAWRSVLPDADIRVVTSTDDQATQDVASRRASVWQTAAWRRDGAAFNKAAALDEAFGFSGAAAPPAPGEWCLALDADVFPGRVDLPDALDDDALYCCDRRLCLDTQTLMRLRRDRSGIDRLRRRNTGEQGGGYFQLFAYRPGLSYGSFPHAGDYDIAFHRHFSRVVNLTTCTVFHLGPTDSKHNWHGQRSVPIWGAT